VMAYGGSALTERSRKQLTAHAGLAPRSRQSGTSLHQQGHLVLCPINNLTDRFELFIMGHEQYCQTS
jgi:hypothetical protein